MRTRLQALALGAAMLLLATLPAAAAAEVPNSEDVFNQQTFNPTDGSGNEIGFETAQNLSRTYNTFNYTFDPQFPTAERNRTGCGGGSTFAFGSRTAWVRFVPAVKGQLIVSASTQYNVILFAYRTTLPRHAKSFTESDLVTITCNDASPGFNEINMVVPSSHVVPGQAILIETASFCGYGPPSPCTGNEPGGPTGLTVSFTPDDSDEDGVPDTKDGCPTTKGEASNNGCPPPDSDGDGVPDRSDVCLLERGVPPTGCPPDADGDGVANENDQCMFQFGTNPGGCPDPDGDGVANRADLCPTVKGIPRDGCPDDDRDGVSNAADRCKTRPGTDPDGCPKPLGARFPDRWLGFPSATKVLKLQVKAPKGSRVRLRCRGRDCRVRRATFRQRRATHSLARYLPRDRMLRKGSILEIRVTAPRTLGTYVRFRIRGLALPSRLDRCIEADGKLRKCPG